MKKIAKLLRLSAITIVLAIIAALVMDVACVVSMAAGCLRVPQAYGVWIFDTALLICLGPMWAIIIIRLFIPQYATLCATNNPN